MPFHAVSSGVDAEAFKRALVTAVNEASAAGIDVIFLVPTLHNVDSDAIVEVFGKQRVDAFKRQREMTVNDVKFHLETSLTKRARGPAIVLGIYLSLDKLGKAIKDHRTKDWVYLPWSEPELASYVIGHPASVAI
jgi:hypothetical protein|tara:strand:- start:368 stop:772 length:405 start_codon:yes stop_codon:yes gene_type:complete